MARSSELLPTPLRPSTQVILPTSAVDGHPPQRLRRAVVQIDALNRQHLSTPVGSMTTSSLSPGGTEAMTRRDRDADDLTLDGAA